MGKPALLFGLCMFAAGLALGALFGGPWKGPDPPSPNPGPPPSAAPPPPVTAPSAVAPSLPARGSDLPVPSADAGQGAITGTVTGPDGGPIEGVLVRGTPAWDRAGDEDAASGDLPPGSPPPRRDVEREVRRFAERLAFHEAGVRETLTDARGNYDLRGLGEKKYFMEAWRAGFLVSRAGAETWSPLPAGGRCDFVATPIRRVSVTVVLPDGTAPVRAVIAWKPVGGGDEARAEWKPTDPGLEIPPGTYAFTAWVASPETESVPVFLAALNDESDSDLQAIFRSAPLTATIGDGEPGSLSFHLEARSGLRVKLVLEGAGGPRSVRIAAMKIDGGAAADHSLLAGDKGVRSAWTRDSTEVSLPGLDPGTYLVGATFRGDRVGAAATAVVGSGLTTVELRAPAEDPLDWIRVRVLDPEGQAVRDAVLECGCRGNEESDEVQVSALPGADGSYRVEHYARGAPVGGRIPYYRDSLGPGPRTWFVRATSPKYGTVSVDYDPAKDREATLRFAAPAVLRIAIAGAASHPRREWAVLELERKVKEGEDAPDSLWATIDASGRVAFPPVAPGPYEVSLRIGTGSSPEELRRARWSGIRAACLPVTLPSGETTLSIPLPNYSDLVVTFEGDAPDIQHIGADGVLEYGDDGEVDAGTVTFKNVPEGRHRLCDSRRGAMWVDLPAAGPVAFRPEPFNALRLEVTGEGYVRELGLRTGDLIVAMDGAEFKDRASIQRAMAAAFLRESARCTIQRDGTTFEVTADVRKYQQDEGSDSEPWVR